MANGLTEYDFKKHFDDFVEVTQVERLRAEQRRDYRDLKQWSENEVANLEARGQAAVVFDQYSKKVDAIIGLEVQGRSDPKAYPVLPKYEQAAEAITDALRYVESKIFFDDTGTEVFEEKIVEGYGGCIVEVNKETLEIEVNQIPWDRIYYDPFSRRKDFKDAKYIGITLWLDIEDAVSINPGKADEIRELVSDSQYEDLTFQDRPSNWVNIDRKRVRINQEFFTDGKIWYETYYVGDIIIDEPHPSPYLDEKGNPCCPIELQSDFVDRDNNRWGYMQRLIDVQDEINHRRSKALFMLSSKTVLAERGAFGENGPDYVLNELRKGMSFIEYNSVGGNPPIIDSQQELGQSQLAFYQDAQRSMDSVGINPELAGRTEGAISGRAFLARQQGGMLELQRVFARHREWKTRVYRQMWSRIKQFWSEEKWVRVTDDKNATRFVGLNIPVTVIERQLEQQSNMDIQDIRARNPKVVDQFIQSSIAEDPLLGQVVETRNDVVQLEMDIIVEEAPDTINIQQEQFDTLANLAGSRVDPQMFRALLKLSNMQNKEEVLELFEPDDQAQQAAAEPQNQAAQVQMAQIQTELENRQADTIKKQAEAQKTLSEIPLNEAKTKDELASAVERVGKTSALPIG